MPGMQTQLRGEKSDKIRQTSMPACAGLLTTDSDDDDDAFGTRPSRPPRGLRPLKAEMGGRQRDGGMTGRVKSAQQKWPVRAGISGGAEGGFQLYKVTLS